MATTFLSPMPQPGDGAWLIDQGGKRRRGRGKLQSFLRPYPKEDRSEVENANQRSAQTFLQHYDMRKEQTPPVTRDHAQPRTIATENLLSDSAPKENSTTIKPRFTTFLSGIKSEHLTQPIGDNNKADQIGQYPDSNYTFTTSPEPEADMTSVAIPKGLPPHQRAKRPTKDCNAPTFAELLPRNVDAGQPALHESFGQTNGVTNIYKKLQEKHGVKVSPPEPVKPTEPMQKFEQAQSIESSHAPAHSNATELKRGNGRWCGPSKPRPARSGRWPDNNATRADPKRWDIKWDDNDQKSFCSSLDSNCADAGFGEGTKTKGVEGGIDLDTGFKLTDWDGNWAPAPISWDARPAFRDNQSSHIIDRWMNGVEEAMCGVQREISIEPVTMEDGSLLHLEGKHITPMGDTAPRYWIPLVFGNQAPQSLWKELIGSKEPKPEHEHDLDHARPWWDTYQTTAGNLLQPYNHPSIKGIDPDETADERLARENDYGSHNHAENRKRTEKAKKDSQRERRKRAQEKASKLSKASPVVIVEKIKPGLNLFLRSAGKDDIPRIREIYNHYVNFSVCTSETHRRTVADMTQRYNDIIGNRLPFLVACERGGKVTGRNKKKKKHADDEDVILPDKVVGFGIVDDYNDLQGMYRFTAEIEIYVDNAYYMKGVGKCLADKLLGMLDDGYHERGGYESYGEELEGIGFRRIIKNIVINLPYDKPEHLAWKGRWLENWLGFTKVGELKGIGNKDGKSVSLAIFQRTTGTFLDAANPPLTMAYPEKP